jgi:hypothetical protein
MPNPTIPEIYFPPSFVKAAITDVQYRTWLTRKAKYIIAEDRSRKRPCVKNATERLYKELIHKAVNQGGQFDPFTGETLQWELVCTWDDSNVKNLDESVFKKYALLPTVDHADPYGRSIDFEICSWKINRSKNNLTPQEYVALCKRIVGHANTGKSASRRGSRTSTKAASAVPIPGRSPQKYFLPDFLKDILPESRYRRWLVRKTSHLYHTDKKQNRPCVGNATGRLYKQLIHEAVLANGLLDRFTGERLRWDLLGTWDDSFTKNPSQALVKKFSLLPTVDHIDPCAAAPGFEICSWLVNRCKSDMTPDEFISQCKNVIAFRKSRRRIADVKHGCRSPKTRSGGGKRR